MDSSFKDVYEFDVRLQGIKPPIWREAGRSSKQDRDRLLQLAGERLVADLPDIFAGRTPESVLHVVVLSVQFVRKCGGARTWPEPDPQAARELDKGSIQEPKGGEVGR